MDMVFTHHAFNFSLCQGCSPAEISISSQPALNDINQTLNTDTTPETETTSVFIHELESEKLYVPLIMKEEDIHPQIYVITSNNSTVPDPIAEIPAEGQLKLDSVDYSNYLVLFVFTGKQNFGDVAHKVTQIWQTDNIIYIHANFPKPTKTVIPGFIYGKFVIKVSKDNMTQFGEIKFILIDQDERQRAVTTCDIPE
jgi:hypothetical protein